MKQRLLNFKMLLLICLLMAVGGENALAQDETLNFVDWKFDGASGWTSSYANHTIPGNIISVEMNANRQTTTVTDCPVTKGKPIIVKLKDTDTYTITGVELLLRQWTTKKQTVTLSVSNDGTNYTNNSSSSNFSLTAAGLKVKFLKFTFSSANQVGIKSIKVKYESASNPKTATTLTFPQESFSFATTDDLSSFKGQTATLKAGETELTGKTIRYSKSGDAIFTSFDETTGALVLNGKTGTAIVKANFAGDDTYASSTASYTVTVDQVFVDLASLKAAIPTTANSVDDAVPFRLKLTDALVTYVNGKKAYVQDATTGVMLFDNASSGNAFGLVAGQKFTGVVDVKACWYNGMAEVTAWTPAADVVKEENVDIPVKTVTLAELNGADYSKYECVRVKVENAMVSTAYSTTKKATIKQGDETYLIHGETNGLDVNKDDVCDFIGYPIYWKTSYLNEHQLSVWSQDDIIVKSSVVKTTISFDPATTEYNVNNNNKDDFTAPTATVKDAEGNIVEGAAITYTSSEPGVATVGETDGTVTFVGFGTTVITASYAGDATHMASKNSYTITYGKVKTTMAWSAPTATANLGETSFDAPTLTLKAGDANILDGKVIKYSSSATDVAEIRTDGTVTIHAEGTTVITATFAGDDTYAGASAEYTLTVTDPNKPEEKSVTFDFMNPSKYGYGVTEGNDEIGKGAGDVIAGKTFVEGIVTWTNSIQAERTCTRFFKDGLRSYADNMHTISVPAGYRITSVSIVFGSKPSKDFTIGDADKNNATWTGDAKSVDIVYTGGTTKMEGLVVKYKKLNLATLTFDENKDNDMLLLENEGDNVNVAIKRSMKADGYWYTLCLPFGIADISTTALKNAQVHKYSSMSGTVMNFDSTTSLEAMQAYIVKPAEDIVNPIFEDVILSSGTNVDKGDYQFVGVISKTPLETDGTNLFLGASNQFYTPTLDDYYLKGLRGYFIVPAGTSASKLSVNIDGVTTGINKFNVEGLNNSKVYNLNGQYVGNDVKSLKKGVYVVNGRKFIVK